MDGLRIVLILLAVLVIIALLAHGLWTIRKNNQQDKEQRQEIERKRRQLDQQGFDELGVGPVRTLGEAGREEPAVSDDADINDELSESEVTASQPSRAAAPVEPKAKVKSEQEPKQPSMFEEGDEKPAPKSAQPEAAPVNDTVEKPEQVSRTETKASDDVEQLPMDLPYEEESDVDEEYPQQDVISLFVSGDIQGAALLQTMTELGLKFGDMDIFERHESPSGHGPVLFRVADMYQPGTFDLDQIENHSTRGIALFMALPLDYDGHKAFTMMYNAANKIAEAMPRAAVLDGNRNPITKQSVQHTYQKIREFERRQKLTGRR